MERFLIFLLYFFIQCVFGFFGETIILPNDLERDGLFGSSVSLSRDGLIALVGAPGKNESGLADAGAAYIFTRPSTSFSGWTQQQNLTAGDGADLEAGAKFGKSVCLSGDGLVALVGAYLKDEGGMSNAGAAYIFSRPSIRSSRWTQQQKLTAPNLEGGALFGHSVSLSHGGLVALVGAHGKNEGGHLDAGAAYIFSRSSSDSSTWTFQQFLRAGHGADLQTNAYFGWSVSLSNDGSGALIGAWGKDEFDFSQAGAAYFFTRPSTSSLAWVQQWKLTSVDGTTATAAEENARFGYSVSLSGDGLVALVGALYKNEGDLVSTGAAYVFSRSSDDSPWTQQQKLLAGEGTDLEQYARFGNSVSLSNNGMVALVGAYWKNEAGNSEAGAAYIFSRPSTFSSTWTQQHKLPLRRYVEPEDYFGNSVSLSNDGFSALIGAESKDDSLHFNAGAAYFFYFFNSDATAAASTTSANDATTGVGKEVDELPSPQTSETGGLHEPPPSSIMSFVPIIIGSSMAVLALIVLVLCAVVILGARRRRRRRHLDRQQQQQHDLTNLNAPAATTQVAGSRRSRSHSRSNSSGRLRRSSVNKVQQRVSPSSMYDQFQTPDHKQQRAPSSPPVYDQFQTPDMYQVFKQPAVASDHHQYDGFERPETSECYQDLHLK